MTEAIQVAVIGLGGTALIATVGFANFYNSRQLLNAANKQLIAMQDQLAQAQRQLLNAEKQPQMQLLQRSVEETNDYLRALLEHPQLRPFFYDNRPLPVGEDVLHAQIMMMAELMLNNFASSIIHSIQFPEYPIGSVENGIKYHLRNSPALCTFLFTYFDQFQVTGLTLLCLKHHTRSEVIADLENLIALATANPDEKQRRMELLHTLQTDVSNNPLVFAGQGLQKARPLLVK